MIHMIDQCPVIAIFEVQYNPAVEALCDQLLHHIGAWTEQALKGRWKASIFSGVSSRLSW
jgi:hypothetical protein